MGKTGDATHRSHPASEFRAYCEYLESTGIEYVEPAPYTAAPNDVEKAREDVAEPSGSGGKSKADALAALGEDVAKCTACALHETRTNPVFGSGDPDARLMFVGEAPGADEDKQGLPFVGRSGKLLTKMIEAMGFKREEVYIANVLKSRPPGNRDPKPDEVQACEPYLKRQIEIIKPLLICALGAHAAHTLLKTDTPIGKLRGRFYDYNSVPLLATYHPAFLMRSPSYKKEAWKDLQLLIDELKNS